MFAETRDNIKELRWQDMNQFQLTQNLDLSPTLVHAVMGVWVQ
jgi:hypothetical protein